MLGMSSSRRPSVMGHQFSQVPKVEMQRSSFDRSHGLKTTFNSGLLIPVFWDEVLPGDTFSLSMTSFARLATPIKPVMDNMYLDSFFFFVPLRLVWANFQKFMGAQVNPGDSTSYLCPQRTSPVGGDTVGSLADYFGIPTAGNATHGVLAGNTVSYNAFHFRAYNLIWNEWFRDQNLGNSQTVDTSDGPDVTNYTVLARGKRHDYFTSCLPWPQKGTAVTIPLGTTAPVLGIGSLNQVFGSGPTTLYESNGASRSYTYFKNIDPVGVSSQIGVEGTAAAGGYPNVRADLSNATAATINALRQSFQIQKMYEKDARGGTRYTELVRSHFGVTSPDARLQRPEYLGGGSSPTTITPIPQTSVTGATPQGNLAGIGVHASSGNGFSKSFTEHGVLIGLISVRADLTYQQGLNRMWTRQTRNDFYWPSFAHLGEQAVMLNEIYCDGSAGGATTVFGYQERHAEYRYKPSVITGQFRSTYSAPLDSWHLAQYYTSAPTLSSTFINDNPPIARVVADNTAPQFLGDFYFKLKCARPMPTYSVPGLIDHF